MVSKAGAGSSSVRLNFRCPTITTDRLDAVEGVATVGLGIIFAFILPSNPRDTPKLNEAQRAWVLHNLQLERGSSDTNHGISSGRAFIMAVTDPKLWLFTGCLYCTYIAGAVVQ